MKMPAVRRRTVAGIDDYEMTTRLPQHLDSDSGPREDLRDPAVQVQEQGDCRVVWESPKAPSEPPRAMRVIFDRRRDGCDIITFLARRSLGQARPRSRRRRASSRRARSSTSSRAGPDGDGEPEPEGEGRPLPAQHRIGPLAAPIPPPSEALGGRCAALGFELRLSARLGRGGQIRGGRR